MVSFKTALALMVVAFAVVSVEGQVRGCYFQDGAQKRPGVGAFTGNSKYKWGLCSHVFFAFAQITTGSNPGITGNTAGYGTVKAFREYNPSMKTIISVGGANSVAGFNWLANNQGSISTWAKNAVAHVKSNGFYGIDLDWEYPAGATQKTAFTNMIKALRSAGGSDFIITFAGSYSKNNLANTYDLGAIKDAVSFINVMTYDYHGDARDKTLSNSPMHNGYFGWIEWTIDAYLAAGVPASKLVLGFPAYGYGFTLASANGGQKFGAAAVGSSKAGPVYGQAGYLAQYEICKMGGSTGYDSSIESAYRQNGNQWVNYENGQSITAKVNYIKQKKLGGAFIWSMDQDDFNNVCGNGPYPVMNKINSLLIGKTFT